MIQSNKNCLARFAKKSIVYLADVVGSAVGKTEKLKKSKLKRLHRSWKVSIDLSAFDEDFPTTSMPNSSYVKRKKTLLEIFPATDHHHFQIHYLLLCKVHQVDSNFFCCHPMLHQIHLLLNTTVPIHKSDLLVQDHPKIVTEMLLSHDDLPCDLQRKTVRYLLSVANCYRPILPINDMNHQKIEKRHRVSP